MYWTEYKVLYCTGRGEEEGRRIIREQVPSYGTGMGEVQGISEREESLKLLSMYLYLYLYRSVPVPCHTESTKKAGEGGEERAAVDGVGGVGGKYCTSPYRSTTILRNGHGPMCGGCGGCVVDVRWLGGGTDTGTD